MTLPSEPCRPPVARTPGLPWHPGATTGLIEKLTAKKVQIEVHQPEKPPLDVETT